MRVALLMLSLGVVGLAKMVAQDAPPAPPPPPAQGGGPYGGRGGGGGGARQLEMMTRQLNLSDDQVTKIKAIQQGTMAKMMAMRDDAATPQDEKRRKGMELRKGEQENIKAVLNDDQKAKYDVMLAKERERMQERGQERNQGGGAGAPPPPPAPAPQQ